MPAQSLIRQAGAKGESFDQLEEASSRKQTSTKTPKTQDPPKDQMQKAG